MRSYTVVGVFVAALSFDCRRGVETQTDPITKEVVSVASTQPSNSNPSTTPTKPVLSLVLDAARMKDLAIGLPDVRRALETAHVAVAEERLEDGNVVFVLADPAPSPEKLMSIAVQVGHGEASAPLSLIVTIRETAR